MALDSSVDLDVLWRTRQNSDEYKMRDQAYKVYEDAFLGRDRDKKEQYVTWRPQMIDGISTGDSKENKAMLNLTRQVVNHHQASFARPPRVRNVPYSPEGTKDALTKTGLIQAIFARSRIKSIQPLVSWRLAVRGDAVLGVEWGQDFLVVRSHDPAECYPDMDHDDIGAMNDLLIVKEVRRDWAEKTFGVSSMQTDKSIKMFIYWTPECRYLQIGKTPVEDPQYTFEHGLGFVPWRWIFNQNNNHMAQADVAEIPKLQSLISDSMLLVMDAARRRVDKSYWGSGITGDATPKPGETVVFPNPQAKIEEFPTSDPPDMLMGVMTMLQNYAQAMGGVSPISMEGMASGSIVTGSAVRHQVEAIEARTETKRVALEHGYAILGEYILRIIEKCFDEGITVRTEKTGEISLKAEDIKQWYTCDADYGDFASLPPTERGRWGLEGIGRVHGQRKAIEIIYPDEDVEAMVKDIEEYQVAQGALTGRAQAAAQAAAGGGGGGSSAPGAPGASGSDVTNGMGGATAPPIQMNQPPPQPGQAALAQAAGGQMVELGQLTSLLDVVRSRIRGQVWAVGEIAITGRSATPRVMVQYKNDEGPVNAAFQGKARVTVGTPGKDEPKVTL